MNLFPLDKTLYISYLEKELTKIFNYSTIIEVDRQIKELGKFENDLYVVSKQ